MMTSAALRTSYVDMGSDSGQIERSVHGGLFRHSPRRSTPYGSEKERPEQECIEQEFLKQERVEQERAEQTRDRTTIHVHVDSLAEAGLPVSLIRQIMASFGFESVPPEHDTHAPTLLRVIIATGSPSAPPPGPPLAQDERGSLYITSDGWEWHGTRYHLKARPENPLARVVLHTSSASESDRRLSLAYAVRHAITSMLPHTGWVPLHGAALEAPRGDGVLLVGASGSGKSTLSAGLVLRGWPCISDDLLFLPLSASGSSVSGSSVSGSSAGNSADSSRSEAVLVEALTTDLRLCPDARDRLHDELVQHATPIDGTDTSTPYGADDKSGYLVSAHPATRPTLVVILSITDAPVSRLEPVSSPAGLRAVLEQMPPIPAFPPALARRMLQTAGDLIRPCSCVRLHAGRDLYDDPGRLEDLLAPHLT